MGSPIQGLDHVFFLSQVHSERTGEAMNGWLMIAAACLAFSVCVDGRCAAESTPPHDAPLAVSAVHDIANVGHRQAASELGRSSDESEGTVRLNQPSPIDESETIRLGHPFSYRSYIFDENRIQCQTDQSLAITDQSLAIFERDHPARSDSSQARFQDELYRLRRRLQDSRIADQIRLTVHVIEVPSWNSWFQDYHHYWRNFADRSSLEDLFSKYHADEKRRIWDVPMFIANSGCPARVFSGRDVVTVSRTNPDGSQSVSQLNFGNSLEMTATIFDIHRIRLTSVLELKDLGPVNPWTGVPALIDRGQMEATIEVTSGQTAYYSEEVRLKSGEIRKLVVAVNADIVSMTEPYIYDMELSDVLAKSRWWLYNGEFFE